MPANSGSNQIVADCDSSVSICSLVDTLSSSYGWSLCEVLDMPMSTALQLLQRVMKRKIGEGYSIRNGITQHAKSIELKKINNNG